jgi:hypothetical protein
LNPGIRGYYKKIRTQPPCACFETGGNSQVEQVKSEKDSNAKGHGEQGRERLDPSPGQTLSYDVQHMQPWPRC